MDGCVMQFWRIFEYLKRKSASALVKVLAVWATAAKVLQKIQTAISVLHKQSTIIPTPKIPDIVIPWATFGCARYTTSLGATIDAYENYHRTG
jgi:hypothetical protein